MAQKPYPLFEPPEQLAKKPHEEWSKKEAEQYRSWLVNAAGDRTRALLEYVGLAADEYKGHELLRELGEYVSKLLRTEEFSYVASDGTRVLTNAGYALAADMGLLTAQILIQQTGGSARWEVLRKPMRDASYNLPVLVGFEKLTLDPVAGSVAESHAILAGRRGRDAWARIFEFWVDRAR